MKMINFEKARTRKHLKEKSTRHMPEIDAVIPELQRQYQKHAQFYNRWYAKHVVGQDEDGRWVYKDL